MRTAWLDYVLRRIDRTCEDGRPTLIIIDEAWKMLGDEKFREKIDDWLRTMRKKNGAVIMMSQQPRDFTASKSADAILANVQTQLLFRDPRNKAEEYMALGLSEGEAAQMVPPSKTRSVLCKSGDETVLLDIDLSDLGPALDVLGGSKGLRAKLGQGWQTQRNFWKDFV